MINSRIVRALAGGGLAVMLAIGLKGAAGLDGVTLEVAGRSNANVSLASDGEFLAAVWSASLPEGATDIFAAVSRDGGRTFSAPTRVNSTPGDAQVNGEQPPRVAIIPRPAAPPSMTVVWTSRSSAGSTLVSARSDDGGRTFGASTFVPHGEAPGNRGWQSVAVDARGQVRVLWLDHRELASPRGKEGAANEHRAAREHHVGHDKTRSKHDTAAMVERSKLYFATVGDEASARMLVGGVCYCCKTALATASDGAIYSAWRHVYPGNLRDIAFAASYDGGRTFGRPVRVSEDRWELDGCPDDGPAMAVDARGGVHLAWPTLVADGPDGKPSIGIFYALSLDGSAFGQRIRLPTVGVPHHPQIVRSSEALYLAWDELTGESRQVVVAQRPANRTLDAPFVRTVIGAGAPGVYPSMVATGRGVVVAWTSTLPDRAVIRVARFRAQ